MQHSQDSMGGKFCSMLGQVAQRPCLFVVAPDVVANAEQTAQQFRIWQPVMQSLGVPVALVLQDGQEKVGIPWGSVQALFIGGSNEFKLGPVAASIVREGKSRGLWVHGGRVNSKRRIRYMASIGCDSVDGSGFSRWPERRIPMGLRWLEGAKPEVNRSQIIIDQHLQMVEAP